MKVFLLWMGLSILLTSPYLANSQTKQETEGWLCFYLNKYLGDSFDYVEWQNAKDKKYPYEHCTYRYFFYKDKLTIEIRHYIQDPPTANSELEEMTTDTIYTKKIAKIDIDSSRFTSDKMRWGWYAFRMCFYFQEFNWEKEWKDLSVVTYNNTQKKITSEPGVYHGTYYLRSKNELILDDKMADRFKHAFEHLVDLLGGNVIKDVF